MPLDLNLFVAAAPACRFRKFHPRGFARMRQNQRIILGDACFSCLGHLSPVCSCRGAGLKSRTSFSACMSSEHFGRLAA